MGHALNRGTFFDARGFAAHVEKYRKRFFRRPINWAMEKSILAAYTPPLRKDVRKPAGFPTPFGWAYPVLFCAGIACGRIPSANWGRALPFPLPLTPRRPPLSPLRRTAPLTQGSQRQYSGAARRESLWICPARSLKAVGEGGAGGSDSSPRPERAPKGQEGMWILCGGDNPSGTLRQTAPLAQGSRRRGAAGGYLGSCVV